MKILIADDDLILRRVLKDLLFKLGHDLEIAADGKEGLAALLKPDPPHLAILDWMMPGFSGVEICRKLRETQTLEYTYVIMLTSRDDKKDRIAAFEAGADAYMLKPFDVDDMRAHIRGAMRSLEHHQTLLQRIDPAIVARRPLQSVEPRVVELSRSAVATTATPATPTTNGTAPTTANTAALKPFASGAALLTKALGGMGLDGIQSVDIASAVAAAPNMGVWSVLILPQHSLWFDLMVETDTGSAITLYQTMTGETAVEADETLDTVREVLNIVQGTFKSAFQKEGLKVVTPQIPKSFAPANMEAFCAESKQLVRYQFSLPGVDLRVTVSPFAAPIEKRDPLDLQMADVLAEPVGMPASPEMVLVNQDTMLNGRQLDKIHSIARNEGNWRKFQAIPHSELTTLMMKE